MSYFKDVYKKRGKWWGETSKEQYVNIAKQYFNDYLLNSPNADIVTLNNVEIDVVVSDNSDDENKITKFFLFDLETSVSQGDLIEWYNDSWIVLRKEKRSFEAYNKVLALRCNYVLKWIDDYGVLKQTPAHLLGAMSNRIEDNFRIASNFLVMPQANKNLKVILPYYPIKSEQRFIVNDEAWRVLERDLTSVDGILYIYLIEDLVDSSDDDLETDVADIDKLNNSRIDISIDTLNLEVGQTFTFSPLFYQNDKIVEDVEFVLTSPGEDYYLTIGGNSITGLTTGNTTVNVSLANGNLSTSCNINVLASAEATNVLQIVGAETIRWGSIRTYTVLYSGEATPIEIDATFEIIDNSENLISSFSSDDTSCTLEANTSGLTGSIKLKATTVHGIIEKDISVVSIWG